MAAEASRTGADPLLHEQFSLPLLHRLAALHQQAQQGQGRHPVIALNGPVGAGKSTLGRQLEALAPRFGLRLMVASIDDLYWPLAERRRRLAGNPFGVNRVPPGSHDIPLLLESLQRWRAGDELRLPRFDKTLAAGEGDRAGSRRQPADALVLEGWLMGCRPLPAKDLETRRDQRGAQPALELSDREWGWLPHWNEALEDYRPLWRACDGLWLLRPQHWTLPRRWRCQAEARQRRSGGAWLDPQALAALVRSSLCSLPPALYQDPLLKQWRGEPPVGFRPQQEMDGSVGSGAKAPDSGDLQQILTTKVIWPSDLQSSPGLFAESSDVLALGAVAVLDGRRRCLQVWRQSSPSASSATG